MSVVLSGDSVSFSSILSRSSVVPEVQVERGTIVAAQDPGSRSWLQSLYAPFRWAQKGVACVKQAAQIYQQSDFTFSRVFRITRSLTPDDLRTARELFSDYSEFKKTKAEKGEAKSHPLHLKENEKRAHELFLRKDKLSLSEKAELRELLKTLHVDETEKRAHQFSSANILVSQLGAFESESRATIESKAIELYQRGKGVQELTLDDYSIIELAVSKVLVKGIDRKLDRPQHVAYLAGVAKEQNRLKSKAEYFTGEDFLRVKVEQLQFLYEDTQNLKWTLTFVEDEPKQGETERTTDVMAKKIEADPYLAQFKDQIILLNYENDLREEIDAYPKGSELSADEFAKKSYKGGAIQVGLRYLAQVTPDKTYKTAPVDAIIYTDCDTSVNLGNSGILLNQTYNENKDIGVGSRRIAGAHVIGKSAERHLQSMMFNSLVRLLLNVQVSDTQVGAKVFKPEVIQRIHGNFSEMSMAFDPEIFRLAKDAGFTFGEDGIIWTDSAIESKSADQSSNMLNGLLRIWERIHARDRVIERKTAPGTLEAFKETGLAIQQEGKLYNSLLQLAGNPKWNFIINHLDDIYHGIAPKDFRNFMNSMQKFMVHLAKNELDVESIQELIDSFRTLVENYKESDAIGFLVHEFPELFDVMELLQKDPSYATVIAPMLFGDNVATKMISKHGYDSFYHFAKAKGLSGDGAFQSWLEEGIETAPKSRIDRIEPTVNVERIQKAHAKLALINDELIKTGEKKKIGIVIHYNSGKTSPKYVEDALAAKMQMIREEFGEFKQIEWDFIVVDSRPERFTELDGVEKYFDQVLERESFDNISGRQIKLPPEQGGKADSVKYGMSVASSESDFVGFVDFSQKIDIREMGNLFASAFEDTAEGKESVAIGSRRLEESEVANKPLPFLLRSMGLNILVKAMFPHLFSISDTQTGFKLFSKGAWQAINAQNPTNRSLAFDIELLQHAARLDFPIHELPVDFWDSNENVEDFQGDHVANLLEEVIQIRAAVDDAKAKPLAENEGRILGGGAENIVYRLANGSIIKIPHEADDPVLVGFLKHVIFKNQKQMGMDDQKDKLITSQFINKLLTSPRFSKLVPALRSWKDLNIFVMKLITSFENKSYKSMGYETAARLGKDLVIPFRFIEAPFAVEIEGKEKVFTAQDNVKQSVMANAVFKDRLKGILDDKSLSEQERKEKIKTLVNEGVALFGDLWKRGLFDLDTNFMCDTGYYPDSDGKERLMVLDPGELIDDTSIIKLDVARNQVDKRYDYIELDIVLTAAAPEMREEILGYYRDEMHGFYDHVEKDLAKPKEEREFGSDQRSKPLSEFKVPFDADHYGLHHVDQIGPTPSQKLREAFSLSHIGYQQPFRVEIGMPALDFETHAYPYTHVVPEMVPVGSIGPVMPLIDENEESQILVLDAGSATRSSLLKYGEKAKTKGGVQIAGKPLYQHAAIGLQRLVQNKLPEGYVVLTSSDDLMEISAEQEERIGRYFQGEDSPGLYWCDLPNGGDDFLPLTVDKNYRFAKEHASFEELSSELLTQVPAAKGFVQHVGMRTVFQGVHNAVDPMMEGKVRVESKGGGDGGSIPGGSVVSEYYGQFLQFNAANKLNGMKTPFLMICKKEFMQDFKENVMPLLPNYTWNEITWENILVRGLKCDKNVWMQSGKPSMLDATAWAQIYNEIQKLKTKHNIRTDDVEQNESRVFKGRWQNFDDPHAYMKFIQETFEGENCQVEGPVKIISDSPLVGINVESSLPGTVTLAKSNIQGKIKIRDLDTRQSHRGVVTENLFYGVELGSEESLEVLPNHLVVNIDGQLYSIRMGKMSKEELKNEMVYRYDSNGIPQAYKLYKEFSI